MSKIKSLKELNERYEVAEHTNNRGTYIYVLGISDYFKIENKVGQQLYTTDLKDLLYIGSTVNPEQRLIDHFFDNSGNAKSQWMYEIRAKRKRPFMRLLYHCENKDRLNYEKYFAKELYEVIQTNILNRSLLPELIGNNKKDLEMLLAFSYNVDFGCYEYGMNKT